MLVWGGHDLGTASVTKVRVTDAGVSRGGNGASMFANCQGAISNAGKTLKNAQSPSWGDSSHHGHSITVPLNEVTRQHRETHVKL